jgi:parallel beta-helix repeat protein
MRFAFKILIISIFFLNFVAFFHPIETIKASGDTLHVGIGQAYSNIQDAINAANESDAIYVHIGIYNENILIDKSLTLTSENKENTIIKGGGSGHVIKITADYVNISSFTIKEAIGEGYDSVILDKVQNCRIIDNIIKNSDDGIYLLDSHWNTISDNIIQDNNLNGIFTSFSDNNIFNNNLIYYNDKGIVIGSYSDDNEIFDNDIKGKQGYLQGIGIDIGTSTTENIIYRNYLDDFADNAKDLGTDNTWYKSSTQQGNYWDDYTGIDEDENGRGDTPYNINDDESIQDIYPLGYFQDQSSENNYPTADAGGPYSGNVDEVITFDASSSTDSDGNVIGYQWDWTNDGVYDTTWLTSSTTIHSYSSTGTYTVKIQVKDNDGKTNTDTAQVTITSENQKPTAKIKSISPRTSTKGESINFHGNGQDSDGIIIEYSWRSNIDGELSKESTFNSSNLSAGIHNIYFKVKDNDGEWSEEDLKNIVINPSQNDPPVADIDGPYTGYTNVTLSFNASGSYDPDGDEIASYLWDFGDGTNGTGETVEHTYTISGNYTVKLTVTDTNGLTNVFSTFANIQTGQNDGDTVTPGIPGFEIIFVLISVVLVLFWTKCRI